MVNHGDDLVRVALIGYLLLVEIEVFSASLQLGMQVRPRGSPKKLVKARQMRKRPTAAEKQVWHILRGRQAHGLKFRRQAVIAGFVVDFYCAEKKLVLELDGPIHLTPDRYEYDMARDDQLRLLGYQVVRIANEMAGNVEKIIAAHLDGRSPLPAGERGRG